ncbi:uncharacterized protein LOC141890286 isoform X2 [Acropora palmata]|uniref:uncharacterized protein LOC141890286 isoform X2 n=1 Tax=Acropora palmata TaxID=6131 RepID=UPI003D9FF74D
MVSERLKTCNPATYNLQPSNYALRNFQRLSVFYYLQGLQLSDHFDRLEPPAQEHPELLWKLKREIPNEGMLMYPEEIQIIVQNAYEGQYLIKPQREFVRLETFKQMLRCLPWVKMFTLGEILSVRFLHN